MNEREQWDEATLIKGAINELLSAALGGFDERLREERGFIRWGLVEKMMSERIDSILQARADLAAEQIERLEAENDDLRRELGLGDGEMTYRQKANSYREELNERCLQVGKLQIERKELEEGLSEMVSWAREIAGDCADDEQREMEEDMMERMDALLSRIRTQEKGDG